jgi:hypothetical protein
MEIFLIKTFNADGSKLGDHSIIEHLQRELEERTRNTITLVDAKKITTEEEAKKVDAKKVDDAKDSK